VVDRKEATSPPGDDVMVTWSGDAKMADVGCRLEPRDLWDKFHALGTEMIITKSGRSVEATRSHRTFLYRCMSGKAVGLMCVCLFIRTRNNQSNLCK